MRSMEELLSAIPTIEQKLQYCFADKQLLALAFVHRSFFNEHRDLMSQHNERLEFLGDSVLGLIVSDFLYAYFPTEPEGRLSSLRSHIIESGSCAQFLIQLGIAPYVLLGKGERMNDGRGRETILADLFEALIGAIYLDGGMDGVKKFFFSHFLVNIEECLNKPARNWKAELQNYSQKKYQKPPLYKISGQTGPEHSKVFHVIACVDEQEIGLGTGSSKKEAEQMAAEDAFKKLEAQACTSSTCVTQP